MKCRKSSAYSWPQTANFQHETFYIDFLSGRICPAAALPSIERRPPTESRNEAHRCYSALPYRKIFGSTGSVGELRIWRQTHELSANYARSAISGKGLHFG
jgi:hypothetical protein